MTPDASPPQDTPKAERPTGATPSSAPVGTEAATATDDRLAPADLLQEPHASSHASGSSAEASAAEDMALQTCSSEEGDAQGLTQTWQDGHPPAGGLSQTDAVLELKLPNTAASDASVVRQAPAVEWLETPTLTQEAAALELSADSALSDSATVAPGNKANPNQSTRASFQLWPPARESLPQQALLLNTSQHGAPLERSVSESALLSGTESSPGETPVKPKRRSLLSRLRPSQGGQGEQGRVGVSALGRTTSDPNLPTRQSSAGLEKLNRPTKRLSLLGLLRRGSSGSAAAAAVHSTAVEGSTDVVDSHDSTASASVVQPAQSGTLQLHRAVTSGGVQPAPEPGLTPQSAPASPRGRGGAGSPPQGTAAQPDLAMGRAMSDPSMLSRLPSGMYGIPATPRRPSLLGRLALGRRSNSIAPEPSPNSLPGEGDPAQGLTLEEVPFAEQPFAEQSFVQQPAERSSAELPSVEQPSAEAGLVEQPFPEKPYAETPSAEQPSVEQPFAGQPSTEHPFPAAFSLEEPQNAQAFAEQPQEPGVLAGHGPAEQPRGPGLSAAQGFVEQSWKPGVSVSQGPNEKPLELSTLLVAEQPEMHHCLQSSNAEKNLAELPVIDGEYFISSRACWNSVISSAFVHEFELGDRLRHIQQSR